MDAKNDIKSNLARYGWTLTNVVEELNKKYGRNDTIQNLSNKISKGTIRYKEILEIADVIGCQIIWEKKQPNKIIEWKEE